MQGIGPAVGTDDTEREDPARSSARIGCRRHEGDRNAEPGRVAHRGDPPTGLDGVAGRAEVVAQPLGKRIEVGDDHDEPPEPGRPSGLDVAHDLEDRLAQSIEALPERVFGRAGVPNPAQVEARRLERGERAIEVGREDDDVVEPQRAIGVRRRLAGLGDLFGQ